MPRIFVNSMANFVIRGGIVSFTLQDQAMRTDQGQAFAAEPETVADIVMRESDFGQLVQHLNQYIDAFEKQAGRPLAGSKPAAEAQASQPAQPAPQAATPADAGGIKIRPRDS